MWIRGSALKPTAVFAATGDRGVSVDGVTISRSGETRSATPQSERPFIGEVPLHRRSAITPAIEPMNRAYEK